MVSSFYSSNEAKQRKYLKENKLRSLNQARQQDVVDDQIDRELGFERQATQLGRLSSRVIDKLTTRYEPKEEPAPSDTILSQLTELNTTQDYDLRLKFDAELDKIESEAKTPSNKQLLKQLKEAIDTQRMADAYEEFVANAIKDAFAEKIQRNLKNLIFRKNAAKSLSVSKKTRGRPRKDSNKILIEE